MTQKITTKRTTRIATALAAITITLALTATSQAHDVLATVKEKYKCQKRDYHTAYLAEVKTIRLTYRDSLAHAAASHRAAVRLCEPSRTLALAQIRAAKLRAAECYREDLVIARKEYRFALAELEAWYAAACRPHHHPQVAVVNVPVRPHYVVKKTTTYTVPTAVTTVMPEVVGPEFYPNVPSTHTSGHASEWELISPEATGPVLEGPAFEGPVLEGPVLEGPTFEGPVLQGPVIEGPVLPTLEPTPAIEVAPTVLLPVPRPTQTTNVVKVTHVTTRPTVVVTKPAVRVTPTITVGYGPGGHGYSKGHRRGHADLVPQRSGVAGSLLVHALRALAR